MQAFFVPSFLFVITWVIITKSNSKAPVINDWLTSIIFFVFIQEAAQRREQKKIEKKQMKMKQIKVKAMWKTKQEKSFLAHGKSVLCSVFFFFFIHSNSTISAPWILDFSWQTYCLSGCVRLCCFYHVKTALLSTMWTKPKSWVNSFKWVFIHYQIRFWFFCFSCLKCIKPDCF